MKTGKEIILDYCGKYDVNSVDHIYKCIENKKYIEQDNLSEINGCPTGYGLSYADFNGDCELTDVGSDSIAQTKQCQHCWERALKLICD